MKTLALEFSTDRRSVAVAVNGAVLSEATETGGRESHPFRFIASALADAPLEREDVECVAVGLGPGSYHGVRSAIAIAQGWQLVRNVRLCGVSSAAAIASEARRQARFGRVTVVIDAHRGEIYLASYDVSPERCQETEALRVATPESARAQLGASQWVVGPEAPPWWPTADIVFPSAAAVARLAADRTEGVAADRLEPLYLRQTSFVKAPPPRVISGL